MTLIQIVKFIIIIFNILDRRDRTRSFSDNRRPHILPKPFPIVRPVPILPPVHILPPVPILPQIPILPPVIVHS